MQIVIDIPNENYQIVLSKIMLACYGCKITELPKGHGRLIDAEALKKEAVMCPTVGNSETLSLDIGDVEHAPTIIEADKEGQE